MTLTGKSSIGGQPGADSQKTFHGINPATGENLVPPYHSATVEEVATAADLAKKAFLSYRRSSGKVRGAFLRKIAEEIEALGDVLLERMMQESALPEGRVKGERGRTCGQLRLFAELVEEGSWADARLDLADPARQPLPKNDIRYLLQGIGPVAVFGPANFPLAFNVAGGDTVSALAAGCPVIVKAHSSHPGTSELVGQAINRAVKACNLPEGVFSLLFDGGFEAGQALVKNPNVKAVGFTGSQKAGRELFNLACARPDPIPFFGELSSSNPVFLFPGALSDRAQKIAEGLYASVTLGVGQFCTNPGLVLMPKGSQVEGFVAAFKKMMAAHVPGTMLNKGVRSGYCENVEKLAARPNVIVHVPGQGEAGSGEAAASAAFFQSDVKTFLQDHVLSKEIFGPATLLLTYEGPDELRAFVEGIEGQLTATVHANDDDVRAEADIISLLELKAGRIVFNGFPTGVEVCPSMVHGGPWPATTDSRFTSVGTAAIYRFARPVCYQDYPQAALPAELRDGNPLGLWRTVDGKRTQN